MKNTLFVVYSLVWNEKKEVWLNPREEKPATFMNKEKAFNFAEVLIDDFMKSKGYSPKYSIGEWYMGSNPIKTHILDISDKNGDVACGVEVMEIDMSNTVK